MKIKINVDVDGTEIKDKLLELIDLLIKRLQDIEDDEIDDEQY